MNKWASSSSEHLQKGQDISMICSCLLCKFVLVGSLFLSNRQAKTEILLGTFIFHSISKHSNWLPSAISPLSMLYKHSISTNLQERTANSPISTSQAIIDLNSCQFGLMLFQYISSLLPVNSEKGY